MRRTRQPRTAQAQFRRWRWLGMSPIEAGNLTAWAVGLPPATDGWTPAQIDRLLFMAWLVRSMRLRGDTSPSRW